MDLNLTKKEFYKRIYNIKRFKFVKSVLKSNMQHKNTTTYKHARNVAYSSFVLAKKLEKRYNLKFNYDELVEAAYLHDFCLYDWHTKDKRHRLHGFRHPRIAAETAKNICGINKEEQEMIKTHMWPLTITKIPKSKEALLISVVDKAQAIKEIIK